MCIRPLAFNNNTYSEAPFPNLYICNKSCPNRSPMLWYEFVRLIFRATVAATRMAQITSGRSFLKWFSLEFPPNHLKLNTPS